VGSGYRSSNVRTDSTSRTTEPARAATPSMAPLMSSEDKPAAPTVLTPITAMMGAVTMPMIAAAFSHTAEHQLAVVSWRSRSLVLLLVFCAVKCACVCLVVPGAKIVSEGEYPAEQR